MSNLDEFRPIGKDEDQVKALEDATKEKGYVLDELWHTAMKKQMELCKSESVHSQILDVAKEVGFDPFDVLGLKRASANLNMLLIFTAAKAPAWVFGRHCIPNEQYKYYTFVGKSSVFKAIKSNHNGMIWTTDKIIQISDYDPIGFYLYDDADKEKKKLGKVSLSIEPERKVYQPTRAMFPNVGVNVNLKVISKAKSERTAIQIWADINRYIHRKLQHGAYNDFARVNISADKKCVIFDRGEVRVCRNMTEMVAYYTAKTRSLSAKEWATEKLDYLGNGHHIGFMNALTPKGRDNVIYSPNHKLSPADFK